jgi:hypothetical protein
MEVKSRGLNKHECFACNIADVKEMFFQDDDLFISFGFLHRNHYFDSKFIKRPIIEGIIISSIQINRRLNVVDSRPILSFYVIRDDRYIEKYKDIFCETILPKINEWYHKALSKPESSIPGVEVLLVEWTGDNFKIHISRFS